MIETANEYSQLPDDAPDEGYDDDHDEGYEACIVCNTVERDPETCQRCGLPLCFICRELGAGFCIRESCTGEA